MEITSGIICLRAEQVPTPAGGLSLNLFGVLGGWTCRVFPALDDVTVVVFWEAAGEREGESVRIEVELREEDGRAVAMGGENLEIPASGDPGIPARGFLHFEGRVAVRGPGHHEFVVFVEHEHKYSIPFSVYRAESV